MPNIRTERYELPECEFEFAQLEFEMPECEFEFPEMDELDTH